MPFNDISFEVYELLRAEFSEQFEFSNAGQEGNQQNILSDIILPIYCADIILADLSELNPNVLYELGIAHSFNKKTIIITKDDLAQLPFDLKQYRTKKYDMSYKAFQELVNYLRRILNGAVNNEVVFSNPVKDFLDKQRISLASIIRDDTLQLDTIDSEEGFLDHLFEVDDASKKLLEATALISSDLEDMAERMKASTQKIQQVNTQGGNGNVSFVRKETKKVADSIRDYSHKLEAYNAEYLDGWNRIEKGSLGLLESKFSSSDENRQKLRSFLRALISFQKVVCTLIGQTKSMKEANTMNLGLERSLNQAIKLFNCHIDTQISQMTQTCSSIDNIIQRSSFVVGSISDDDCLEQT